MPVVQEEEDGRGINTLVTNSPTQFYHALSYDITNAICTGMYTLVCDTCIIASKEW